MIDKIRVAVAASVLAVRVGLRSLLQGGSDSGDSPIEVVWEAGSLAELLDLPGDPDVVVLTEDLVETDLRGRFGAPGSGLEEVFQDRDGQVALLLLAHQPQSARDLARLPLRAWGVLSIETSAEELALAVQALHAGLLVGSPALMKPLLADRQLSGREDADPLLDPLTEREAQVLQLLAQGLANKQIALALGISEHTVKFHISALFSKLGAGSRTEAIRLGVQRGLVVL